MPPKPRPIRKTSLPKPANVKTPGSDTGNTADKARAAAVSMPPPPVPNRGILEPEVAALAECLRNAVVKTGQLIGFHADAKRLGLVGYVPNPPRTLVAALGREVERYDQLCDMIEMHLNHAIAVLQKELAAEEEKLRAQEAAEAKVKTPAVSPTALRSQLPHLSTGTLPAGGSTLSMSPTSTDVTMSSGDQTSPTTQPESSTPRRASVISLSSLHRPFPHKLDLSAPTLRLSTDDYAQGLTSPVTLAPRSARPNSLGDLPPELLAIVAESTLPQAQPLSTNQSSAVQNNNSYIDLTLSDSSVMDLNMALGGSADKPIELDLDTDMSELFGDTHSSIQSGVPSHNDADIFAALADASIVKKEPEPISLADDHLGQASEVVPSPETLLASFSTTAATGEQQPESFDLTKLEDLSKDPNFDDMFANSAPAFGDGDEDIRMVDDLLKLDSGTAGAD